MSYWKWRLSREAQVPKAPAETRKRRTRKPKLIELTPVSVVDERVEIELSNGHRLRVPTRFDSEALSRLMTIVGVAP